MGDNIYNADVNTGSLISDCTLNPSDVSQETAHWLRARNNKYPKELINPAKVGKWMIFLPPDQVNEIWIKIKEAVKQGDLWRSKVSTVDPAKPNNHAIMIYTKDYSDLQDVISVLDYLENSGIKPPQTTIKYKTDEQTRAGIYSGGKQKPFIYTSKTVRTMKAPKSYASNWRSK